MLLVRESSWFCGNSWFSWFLEVSGAVYRRAHSVRERREHQEITRLDHTFDLQKSWSKTFFEKLFFDRKKNSFFLESHIFSEKKSSSKKSRFSIFEIFRDFGFSPQNFEDQNLAGFLDPSKPMQTAWVRQKLLYQSITLGLLGTDFLVFWIFGDFRRQNGGVRLVSPQRGW